MDCLHLAHQLRHLCQHLVDRVAWKDPHVDIEDIVARDGVDVGHVRLFFGRRKRRSVGLEKRIVRVENRRFEGVYPKREVTGREEGVRPLVGSRTMALLALRRNLEPAEILLGHLDFASLGIAPVGHHDDIVLPEQLLCLQEVLDAMGRAHLLVRYKEKLDRHGGHSAGGDYRQGREDGTHESLLVILDTTTVDAAVLTKHLEGIGYPHAPIAFGHHVEVAHEPDPAGVAQARNGRDHVGPLATRDPRVGRIKTLDLMDALRSQPANEGFSLLHLTQPTRLGSYRGNGGEEGLQFDDAVGRAVQPFEGFLFKGHGVFLLITGVSCRLPTWS